MKLTVIMPAVIVLAAPGWLAAQNRSDCTPLCVIETDPGWQLSGRQLYLSQHFEGDPILESKSANQDVIINCGSAGWILHTCTCLLYTSDAADE